MTTTALILSIAIAAFGSLLLIFVALCIEHQKDVERKEKQKAEEMYIKSFAVTQFDEKLKEQMYKKSCLNPLVYPVCVACDKKNSCENLKKINV